jgi:hypothetical protein
VSSGKSGTASVAGHRGCARIIGWAPERERAVEHALDSIYLSIERQAVLVLLGETDMVPIAAALHRATISPEQPFVVCDRKRGDLRESVRSRRIT